MNMEKSRLVVVVAFGVFGIASIAGCSKPAQGPTGVPQLSAGEKAKMAEQAKQAEISVRTEQINRSNLPPEQKQRLLNQVRSPGGK